MDAGFCSDHTPVCFQVTHVVTEGYLVFCFNKHVLEFLAFVSGTGIEGKNV